MSLKHVHPSLLESASEKESPPIPPIHSILSIKRKTTVGREFAQELIVFEQW